MVVKTKNLVMATVGVALAMNFSACNKDNDKDSDIIISQTDLLVGEWKLVTINNQIPENIVTFDFEADQDVQYCYENVDGKYCYAGEWEWTNGAETELSMEISQDGDLIEYDLKIDSLSNDVMEGELTLYGNYTYDFEMEKQ